VHSQTPGEGARAPVPHARRRHWVKAMTRPTRNSWHKIGKNVTVVSSEKRQKSRQLTA